MLKKRQEQYNKKTSANRTARALAEKKAAAAAEAQQQQPDGGTGAAAAKGDVIHTKTLAAADAKKDRHGIIGINRPNEPCTSSFCVLRGRVWFGYNVDEPSV